MNEKDAFDVLSDQLKAGPTDVLLAVLGELAERMDAVRATGRLPSRDEMARVCARSMRRHGVTPATEASDE